MFAASAGHPDAGKPRHPYPPLADYGIIGDCRTAALISRQGSIDWLCLPNFSSPSLFARILDWQRGGGFSIRPGKSINVHRRYIGATPILETTFETQSGVVRLIDAMPVLDSVNALRPTREVLRVIEGVAGEVEMEVRLEPRPNYGQLQPKPENRQQLGWRYAWSNQLLIVRSDITLAPRDGALHGSVRVRAGERRYVRLAYMDGDIGVIPELGGAADHDLQTTLSWWRRWSGHCTYQGPYRDAVLRSVITLKLLSFALSGAIVAAPTTSLPEDVGGARNWDYRYCWLRDAGLTMRALVSLGFHQEAQAFLSWLLHATRLTWPKLQVVYDVYGRTRLRERLLGHLDGYCGSRPVRVGNNASAQDQLDIYGEVVLAVDAFVQGGGELDDLEARMVAGLGKVVCRQWRDPDHGIWEIPGDQRQYTFSKITCWMALDGLLKLNEAGVVRLGRNADRFRRERQAILDTIEQRGFNTTIGSYVSELDGSRVDASLLLMVCLGYKDAGDPRMISTYDCIARRLERDGLFYRYEAGYDSLDGREGAFGICSFWAIDNLVQRGEIKKAERQFEHLLKFANDLGLFGEEIDPNTGAVLGNFPQAFTHVGLINAATAIRRSSGDRQN